MAAGNETYAPGEVLRILGPYLRALGDEERVLALGRPPGAPRGEAFGMTDLALRTSRSANAVSRRHGEVARAMWAHHWPGRTVAAVPISHVTNGVHLPTWMAPRMQVVIAGKAHPKDDGAKRMVQSILSLKDQPMAGDRTVFLEDYDLAVAREVVAGCDVWLNLPRAQLEASGTSGMKAAVNGGLNLSVLDGWWCEGYDGTNGWAIEAPPAPDGAIQDARDADELYRLLEREIVPAFYEREARGVPRRWLRLVKASLRSLAPAFASTRMLDDYVAGVYGRAADERAAR